MGGCLQAASRKLKRRRKAERQERCCSIGCLSLASCSTDSTEEAIQQTHSLEERGTEQTEEQAVLSSRSDSEEPAAAAAALAGGLARDGGDEKAQKTIAGEIIVGSLAFLPSLTVVQLCGWRELKRGRQRKEHC